MSRGNLVQFSSAELIPDPVVPVIGPVAFTVYLEEGQHHVDWSHLPCPRLVRGLAQAVMLLAGEAGVQRRVATVRSTVACVERFVAFVAESAGPTSGKFGLADLTPQMLLDFENSLAAHHGPSNRKAYLTMVKLLAVLRAANETHPGVFGAEMQSRLAFSTVGTPVKAESLDAYPSDVFDAIEAAALADVRAIRDRIVEGERLAAAGEDPSIGGWYRLENLLWLINQQGLLTRSDRDRPGMYNRIARSFGGLRTLHTRLHLSVSDVLSFVVLLACQTGLEAECIKELRADCLVNASRGFVSITYHKRRARSNPHKTLRVVDGGALHHPGGVIRLAQRLTSRSRAISGSNQLWVHVRDWHVEDSFTSRRPMRYADRWLSRHGIDRMVDRGGQPVTLDLRRLRKSYKSRRYLRVGGVLDDFAQGHTSEVAAAAYGNIDAHRTVHEQAAENGIREALDTALAPLVIVGDDGHRLNEGPKLDHQALQQVQSGETDVWLASCRDFYASPFAVQAGTGCPSAVWGCLECPNAVFTTRHLPSILSFVSFLETQRDEYSTAEWTTRCGLTFQRITAGVLPRFTRAQVATARTITEATQAGLRLPIQLMEHLR